MHVELEVGLKPQISIRYLALKSIYFLWIMLNKVGVFFAHLNKSNFAVALKFQVQCQFLSNVKLKTNVSFWPMAYIMTICYNYWQVNV